MPEEGDDELESPSSAEEGAFDLDALDDFADRQGVEPASANAILPASPTMETTASAGTITFTPPYIFFSLTLTEPALNGDCDATDQSTSPTTRECNNPPADNDPHHQM